MKGITSSTSLCSVHFSLLPKNICATDCVYMCIVYSKVLGLLYHIKRNTCIECSLSLKFILGIHLNGQDCN